MRLEGQDRRAATRVEARALAHYGQRRRDGLWHLNGMGTTEDVSLHGLRIETPDPLPVGETIEIALRAGESVRPARARVCWVQERRARHAYAAGLELEAADIEFLAAVSERGLLDTVTRSPFEGVEIGDFLRLLSRENASGLLAVEGESGLRAFIALRDGEVIAARGALGATGIGAVSQSLSEARGNYRFLPSPLAPLIAEHSFRLPESFVGTVWMPLAA